MFWLILTVYVMLGIGTARHIAGATRRYMIRKTGQSGTYWNFDDPDIMLPTVFGGVLWPLAWVYLLILRPIVKVIGPGFAAWWMKPYREAAKR